MLHVASVVDVLGLTGKDLSSPYTLIARIAEGLPASAVERVAQLLAPDDAQFKYRLIPKATYERRKVSARLSPEEGAQLARLARVWGMAVEVWRTDAEARAFLFRPHAMLDDRQPIDLVIQSEIGADLVLDVLGGLAYGSAA